MSAEPIPPYLHVAEAVRQLRGELTQTEFAEVTGISQPRISQLESGDTALSGDAALKLARAPGADLAELAAMAEPRSTTRRRGATLRAARKGAIPRLFSALSYHPVPTALPSAA